MTWLASGLESACFYEKLLTITERKIGVNQAIAIKSTMPIHVPCFRAKKPVVLSLVNEDIHVKMTPGFKQENIIFLLETFLLVFSH